VRGSRRVAASAINPPRLFRLRLGQGRGTTGSAGWGTSSRGLIAGRTMMSGIGGTATEETVGATAAMTAEMTAAMTAAMIAATTAGTTAAARAGMRRRHPAVVGTEWMRVCACPTAGGTRLRVVAPELGRAHGTAAPVGDGTRRRAGMAGGTRETHPRSSRSMQRSGRRSRCDSTATGTTTTTRVQW
jgi:hypothetical protein